MLPAGSRLLRLPAGPGFVGPGWQQRQEAEGGLGVLEGDDPCRRGPHGGRGDPGGGELPHGRRAAGAAAPALLPEPAAAPSTGLPAAKSGNPEPPAAHGASAASAAAQAHAAAQAAAAVAGPESRVFVVRKRRGWFGLRSQIA